MPFSLPPEFWFKERDNLRAVLLPQIAALVKLGVALGEQRIRAIGIGFDPDAAQVLGMRWARQYTDDLLNVLGTTNERIVGEAVATWLDTPGATFGDLKDALLPALDGNDVRADATAITETTRAISQGNVIAYTQAGAIPPPMFQGPDGVLRPFGPPGHVNCRCDPVLVLYQGKWIIVWETLNDHLVCTRPVDTPWGRVKNGCQALQGVCISECEWLGQKVR